VGSPDSYHTEAPAPAPVRAVTTLKNARLLGVLFLAASCGTSGPAGSAFDASTSDANASNGGDSAQGADAIAAADAARAPDASSSGDASAGTASR
jgi:hypothetical protein